MRGCCQGYLCAPSHWCDCSPAVAAVGFSVERGHFISCCFTKLLLNFICRVQCSNFTRSNASAMLTIQSKHKHTHI